uniref:Uncharacterized protein n=1 Tax=Arundo donax TaxID=35708 RepID=A0A0A9EUQ6_ARUDO
MGHGVHNSCSIIVFASAGCAFSWCLLYRGCSQVSSKNFH